MTRALLLLPLLLLSACGGGDDSAPPPAPPAQPPAFSMEKTQVEKVYLAGTVSTLDLDAYSDRTPVGPVYVQVDGDIQGIKGAEVVPQEGNHYLVRIQLKSSVPPGTYEGKVNVSLCPVADCATQYPGTPIQVDYKITASDNSGLTPLVRWETAGEWETLQGNARHTGYVPVTLDPKAFAIRWTYQFGSGIGSFHAGVATGDGKVYLGTESRKLVAIGEQDGQLKWEHDFSYLTFPSVNSPAASGGKVFVQAGQQSSTYLFALDGATGEVDFQSQMGSQWEHYLAPVVADGVVYTGSGTYGGLWGFKTADGSEHLRLYMPQYEQWAPAVSDGKVYAYMSGNLYVIAGGEVISTLAEPSWSWDGYSVYSAPVVGAADSVFIVSRRGSQYQTSVLARFDTKGGTQSWGAAGRYVGTPAYHGGVVYAVQDTSPIQLDARSETSGALLASWTAPAPGIAVSEVLLTQNLAFVSTSAATYAIDRQTGKTVWSIAESGALALSPNGILYINNVSGRLVAVNVQFNG